MKARETLRAATAAEHERVDRLFSRFDLADRQDYARFLSAQGAAFLPIEAALDAAGAEALLDDWPQRRRGARLRADLAALGLGELDAIAAPALADAASMLGAIYVLEGSRLGGTLLRRSLGPGLPHGFLGANQGLGSWRKLLEILDELLYPTASLETAVAAARAVFQCFEAGGLRYLETVRE